MATVNVRYCFSADERNNAIAELAPRLEVESAFSDVRGKGYPTWVVFGADTKQVAKTMAESYLLDFEESYSIVLRYKDGNARNVGIDRIVAAQEFIQRLGLKA